MNQLFRGRPLLAASLLACCPCFAVIGRADVERARSAFAEWAEIKSQVGQEKSEWTSEKALLADTLETARAEMEALEKRIEEITSSSSEADGKRAMYQAIVLLPLLGAIFAGFFGRFVGARACEVHRVLAADDPGLPRRVADLVEGKHELPYLARAVSGTFDVDRCDYLLRDAHSTGVRYGDYDLPWLLSTLMFGHARDGEAPC